MVHKSFRGKEVDMAALAAKNADAVAVTGQGSGARMNARGDYLNTGGEIRRRREDIEREYNTSLEGQVKTDTNVVIPDTFITPVEAIKQLQDEKKAATEASSETAPTTPPVKPRRRLIEDEDKE